jgi:hypothetical protein
MFDVLHLQTVGWGMWEEQGGDDRSSYSRWNEAWTLLLPAKLKAVPRDKVKVL